MAIRDENGFTLVDWDKQTGRTVWAYYDGEKTIYRKDEPVAETIKENREMFNTTSPGFKADWHHVASVPLGVHHDSGLHEAIRQGDRKWARRWLNDSDNRAWRTKGGTL